MIYESWCLFTRLCSCWLQYDLCELVFIFQVVFMLASVWFMRVGVCFPGCVRVGFGMIYASWCLFSRLCFCWLRYDLCGLVFVLQAVFVLIGDCCNVTNRGYRAYEEIAGTSSRQVFLLKKSHVNQVSSAEKIPGQPVQFCWKNPTSTRSIVLGFCFKSRI